MNKKSLIVSLAAILLAACAARPVVSPPPAVEAPPPVAPAFDLEGKIVQAEALFNKGGYVHLRGAFSLYQEIEKFAPDKKPFAAGYAMTALLLAIRAKETGVRNDAYLEKGRELVGSGEALAALAPAVEIVDLMPVKTLGVWDDSPAQEAAPQEKVPDLELAGTDLTARLAAGPFFAYLHAVVQELAGQNDEAKADLAEALKMFPDSLLLKFKQATLLPPDLPLLEAIAEEDSEFFESFLGQGQVALAGGALITAEKHLLRAQEGVPESPLIAILLASVNFGTEEYDRSLAFYEKTLDVAPAYKEALLGKAICLSCLGRSTESIPVLEDLLARGPGLKGECLFWLAANFHELGDNERAAIEIEKAKDALPVGRVFTLAGTIAFERGLLDAAEMDFKAAVGLDTGESDAFFGLGKIYAQKAVWMDSAMNFMFAGYGFEFEEKKIQTKIGQVEGSTMPEERKA
ncbi:MAG: tetratricopeptide repeat protein, partial [Candidatus Aminicenantes bacterium]|nr:tetratricopeptide repeat protein [Candidatus Aminicenantes bacterium]